MANSANSHMSGNDKFLQIDEERLDKINDLLIELAAGNFDAIYEPSDSRDSLDAVLAGINILGQELKNSTVSRDYLSSIYRGVVDLLIILNPDKTFQKINDTVTSLLGFEEDSLIGKPFNLIQDKQNQNILDEIDKKLTSKGFCESVELIFVTNKGNKVPVSCSASLLYDKQSSVSGVLYIAKDISKLKQTEHKLITKNRELDAFVYRASHDLKGPIARILGLAEIANMQAQESPVKNYLSLIQQTAEKLDSTLIGLMELASLNNNVVEAIPIDFKALISDTINNLSITGKFQKEINIIQRINNRNVFCSIAQIMNSLFQNMIENAIKYRRKKENDFLKIIIQDKDQGVEIIFEDNGSGIPEEAQSKVFDMFKRATRASKGSGLGLYIVKKSLEKLKGTVELKSKVNEGTRFTIYIPSMVRGEQLN